MAPTQKFSNFFFRLPPMCITDRFITTENYSKLQYTFNNNNLGKFNSIMFSTKQIQNKI